MVVSIINQKGGVGKTTTCLNLGVGLSLAGKKVLLIDFDPQGSLTASLGYEPDEIDYTISNVLAAIIKSESYNAQEGLILHKEGISLMPSNIELSGLEISLVNTMSREKVLTEYISTLYDQYDYIIIDSNPSLGMLTINALAASDSIIIPAQAQFLPVKGLEQLLRTVNKVRNQINQNLKIEGILLTMVDRRTNFSKDIIQLVNDVYGGNIKIFKEPIPTSIRLSESNADGKSIFSYDPKGKAAAAYTSLVNEVLYG